MQVSLASAGTIRKLHLSSPDLRLPLKVLLPPSTKPPRENFWPPVGNATDWVIRLRKALSGKPNRMRLSDFPSVFSTYIPPPPPLPRTMAKSPGVRFLLFVSIHTLRPLGKERERKWGWFELDERKDLKMTCLLPMACGGMWVAWRLCCAFQVSASRGFKAGDRGIWDSCPSDHVVRRLVNQDYINTLDWGQRNKCVRIKTTL